MSQGQCHSLHFACLAYGFFAVSGVAFHTDGEDDRVTTLDCRHRDEERCRTDAHVMLQVHRFTKQKELIQEEEDSPVALQGMKRSEWEALEQQAAPPARELLHQVVHGAFNFTNSNEPSSVFEAVQVSLPLEPPILSYEEGHGDGQAHKNIAGLQSLRERTAHGVPCVIYGLGIADDSGFEQEMASIGCETHAFDCTVDPMSAVVANKDFRFHQWCVGQRPAESQNEQDNVYVSSLVHVQEGLPCDKCTKKVEIISGPPAAQASTILLSDQRIAVARGITVATIDPATEQVVSNATYDVFAAAEPENARLAADLNALPEGRIVVMAVHDSGLEHLKPNGLEAMQRVGATIDGGKFREGYAFLGRVGHKAVVEKRSRDMKHKLEFKSLAETMQELGHSRVDLLKFDIEGYEWQLFQTEIFSTQDRKLLPEQLSFELHTKGANPSYVPAELVQGKGPEQVGMLFLGLFHVGYRVISKEINSGDGHCAEFVALKIK